MSWGTYNPHWLAFDLKFKTFNLYPKIDFDKYKNHIFYSNIFLFNFLRKFIYTQIFMEI